MELTCTIYHLLARMVEITEGDLDSPPWGYPYNESRLNSCGLQGESVSSTVFFSIIVVFMYVRVHLYVCIHHLYMHTVFGLRPAPQSPGKRDRDKDRESFHPSLSPPAWFHHHALSPPLLTTVTCFIWVYPDFFVYLQTNNGYRSLVFCLWYIASSLLCTLFYTIGFPLSGHRKYPNICTTVPCSTIQLYDKA